MKQLWKLCLCVSIKIKYMNAWYYCKYPTLNLALCWSWLDSVGPSAWPQVNFRYFFYHSHFCLSLFFNSNLKCCNVGNCALWPPHLFPSEVWSFCFELLLSVWSRNLPHAQCWRMSMSKAAHSVSRLCEQTEYICCIYYTLTFQQLVHLFALVNTFSEILRPRISSPCSILLAVSQHCVTCTWTKMK